MLKAKGLKLDAVIELKVDEGILLKRIKKRVSRNEGAGGGVTDRRRPGGARRRLVAYRDRTAPFVAYYQTAERAALGGWHRRNSRGVKRHRPDAAGGSEQETASEDVALRRPEAESAGNQTRQVYEE